MSDLPRLPNRCVQCATELSAGAVECPSCRRLVHTTKLRELARDAEAAERAGTIAAALELWRTAHSLLPPDSNQGRAVLERIRNLSGQVEKAGSFGVAASPSAAARPNAAKGGTPVTTGAKAAAAGILGLGLLFWKFKFILVAVLSKLKFLLLGLSKGKTLFSMFLTIGLYWTVFGWKFALGLVASIYVHEMGHIVALKRFGIPASAPMFIPGLGALIRTKHYPATPIENARVGLAGPVWGLGAALAAYAVALSTGAVIWAAIAKVGAWVNLFNLTPIFGLDGDRGFASQTRMQRWLLVLAMLVAFVLTSEGLLLLVLVLAVAQAFRGGEEKPDWIGFAHFLFLIAALSAMTLIPVPGIE